MATQVNYSAALLQCPCIAALSEDDRESIWELLDEQRQQELVTFLGDRVPMEQLSEELKIRLGDDDCSFDAVLPQLMFMHRARSLREFFQVDPMRLIGKAVTVVIQPGSRPREVVEVTQDGATWTVSLQGGAALKVKCAAVDDRDIVCVDHQALVLTDMLPFLLHTVQHRRRVKSLVMVGQPSDRIADSIAPLDSSTVYELEYKESPVQRHFFSRHRSQGHVHSFSILEKVPSLVHGQRKQFTLQLSCTTSGDAVSAALLDSRGNEMPNVTLAKLQRSRFRVMHHTELEARDWMAIAVRKGQVTATDRDKIRRLESIDRLRDEIMLALLHRRASLNRIVNAVIRCCPADTTTISIVASPACATAASTAVDAEGEFGTWLKSRLQQLNNELQALAALSPGEGVMPDSDPLVQLVLRANHQRWLARPNSLVVLKAMELFSTYMPELERMQGKESVLVVGNTGAGKSALINALLEHSLEYFTLHGSSLVRIADYERMSDEQRSNAPRIGQSLGTSETAFTKGYFIPERLLCRYTPSLVELGANCLLVDCPGFRETRGISYQILTMLSVEQAIRCTPRLRAVVLVVDAASLELERCGPLVQTMQLLHAMLPEAFEQSRESDTALDALFLVFNRCPRSGLMQHAVGFEGRMQDLLRGDEAQLQRQRASGAIADVADTEERIRMWQMLLRLHSLRHVTFLDVSVTGRLQRKDLLASLIRSPGIVSDRISNIFETPELKTQLLEHLNVSASQCLTIMKTLVETTPSDIRQVQSRLDGLAQQLVRSREDIASSETNITSLQRSIAQAREELAQLEHKDGTDAAIAARMRERIRGLRDSRGDELSSDILALRQQIARANREAQQHESEEKANCIAVAGLQAEIAATERNIARLQSGSSSIVLHETKVEETVRAGTLNRLAWDAAFEEVKVATDAEFVAGTLKDFRVADYRGKLLTMVHVSREYYILPASYEERQAVLSLGEAGKYKAVVRGHNYRLVRAKAADRNRAVYEFELTYDGSCPYFTITHEIPNVDKNRTTVENLQAEVILPREM